MLISRVFIGIGCSITISMKNAMPQQYTQENMASKCIMAAQAIALVIKAI